MRFVHFLFAVLILSQTASCARAENHAVDLKRVVFQPTADNYHPGQVLYLHLDLENSEEKALNLPVEVRVDGREVYSGFVRLSGSKAETVKIGSNLFDKDYNAYDCEEKSFEVLLPDSSGVSSMEAEFRLSGATFSEVGVSPRKPSARNVTEITVLDERGVGHPSARVRVTNLGDDRDFDSSDESVEYQSLVGRPGAVRIVLADEFEEPSGRYQVDVWALGYCLTGFFFDVAGERSLFLSEASPVNPVPGEQVSVQVLDEAGVFVSGASLIVSGGSSLPATFFSDAAGMVYFTVNDSGEYVLSVAKDGFSGYSKRVVVSTKPVLGLRFPESEAVVGKPYPVFVVSGEDVVGQVNVTVTAPYGTLYFINGSVSFTPNASGEYAVAADKDSYVPAKASFTAYSILDARLAVAGYGEKEALVKVVGADGSPVRLARVTVKNSSTSGLTDDEGVLKFALPRKDLIEIEISKEGYKPKGISFRQNKTLSLKVSGTEFELGDKVTLYTLDEAGDYVVSEITVTKPDGSREVFLKDKHSFSPAEVGEYEVSASKDGFSPGSVSFAVVPRPLDLSVNLSGGVILVRAESGGEPVGGLQVWVDAPSRMDYVLTNSRGVASFDAREEGIYAVYVNSTVYSYNRKSLYNKNESESWKLIPFLIGLVFFAALAYAAYFLSKKRPRKKEKKPTLRSV